MEAPDQAFASSVKRLRLARNWTQGELASRIAEAGYPMSLNQVSNTETLGRTASVSDQFAFMKAFGVSLYDLFGIEIQQDLLDELLLGQRVVNEISDLKIKLAATRGELAAASKRSRPIYARIRAQIPVANPEEIETFTCHVEETYGVVLANVLRSAVNDGQIISTVWEDENGDH